MTEHQWDRILHIKTTGRDDSRSDQYRYPYEPTPYSVLERLADSGYIGKNNTLIDYGCGKGRVSFFLSFQLRCHCIGVEYDERIFEAAMRNRENAGMAGRVEFVCAKAEEYAVPDAGDCLYFFNPFSTEILKSVLERVRESWFRKSRSILLFFYYPSDEYVSYLMSVDEMMFMDEVDCRDLFEGDNPRERIEIFEFGY